MNFSQKIGILLLIIITSLYVYVSFFAKDGFHLPSNNSSERPAININDVPEEEQNEDEQQDEKKQTVKNIKIYVTDAKGNLRSVNRKCDTAKENSCFAFAIKQLISAPTQWEKNKGLSSEIPSNTKILSVREGSNNILIDLSSAFESGGGAESIYIRIHQLIKTAQANSKLPVYLYINGKQANVIGGEGIMIKQPLTEKSLDD